MKQIHVECKPDEALVKKFGYTKKTITHHSGKAKVFGSLKDLNNQYAMVDEDPGSLRSNYEINLNFIEEEHGVKVYNDNAGNKIVALKIKLEDWIITACKQSKIKLSKFGLPDKANDLHDIINLRLSNLEKLIEELLIKKNPAILKLKEVLK